MKYLLTFVKKSLSRNRKAMYVDEAIGSMGLMEVFLLHWTSNPGFPSARSKLISIEFSSDLLSFLQFPPYSLFCFKKTLKHCLLEHKMVQLGQQTLRISQNSKHSLQCDQMILLPSKELKVAYRLCVLVFIAALSTIAKKKQMQFKCLL